MIRYFLLFLSAVCWSCDSKNQGYSFRDESHPALQFRSIGDIPVPAGYQRVPAASNSFAQWLRQLSLKKDSHVYLYNGAMKRNQSAQFAVVDISVGDKDLQQCADAIMRLRAEYWMSRHLPDSISFTATNGQLLPYATWRTGTRYKLSGNRLVSFQQTIRAGEGDLDFNAYLELIFTYCGTLSLHRDLKPIADIKSIQPGDIWVKPGSPGHAVIVIDVAIDQKGQKQFMLAQSYMPAQDIHVVRNPSSSDLSPWYIVQPGESLVTPEWEFEANQLYSWRR